MASLLRRFASTFQASAQTTSSSPRSRLSFLRPFSSTPSACLNGHPDINKTPPYPHGFSRHYKQSNRGLYGNIKVRTNARVVGKFPAQRTIRRWHPNIHRKRLYSPCLGRYIRVKIVIRVLRTIDKVGGIDNYLLGQSPGRVKELGPTGWTLRWRLLRTEKGKQIWEDARRDLGLSGEGPRDTGWLDPVALETDRLQNATMAMMTEELLGNRIVSEEGQMQLEREIDEALEREEAEGEAGGLEIGPAEGQWLGARSRQKST